MMTDYNDGNWHGWNGGECPVHPKSVVETIWRYHDGELRPNANNGRASTFTWRQNSGGKMIAFRVVKPYREPREFWAFDMGGGVYQSYATREEVDRFAQDRAIYHFREVID